MEENNKKKIISAQTKNTLINIAKNILQNMVLLIQVLKQL